MTRPSEDVLSLIPATAVISMLLLAPGSSQGLAQGTVDKYSLPQSAAKIIDEASEQDVLLEETSRCEAGGENSFHSSHR